MTLDRYGHLLPGLGDSLADALDTAYESAGAAPENVVPLHSAFDPDLGRSSVYAW